MEKRKIGIYRLIAYFTIYTIAGYIIETLFALIVYGKIESRQGLLYGPFCPIYGVGAVAIIYTLKNLKNNVHTLFIGGFIVGGVVEYLISLFGELVMNVKWWDYSGRVLNINGRICVAYCFFWGILTVYLLKILNPKVDKIIEKVKDKIDIKKLKKFTIMVAVLLVMDTALSTIAVNAFTARTIIENNLNAKNLSFYEKVYDKIYRNEKSSAFFNKYWGEEFIIKIYPNLRITLEDGSGVYVQEYYKHVQPYYFKIR